MAMNVTSRCSRAGAEALRQGAQLAADARDTFRAGALLLRGSPFAVGLGRRLAVHRVSAARRDRACVVPDRRGRRSAASARRGPPSARIKPSPPRCRGPSGPTIAIWCLIRPLFRPHAPPAAVGSAGTDRTAATRRETSDISYGPHGRDNLLDIWRRHDLAPGPRAPVLHPGPRRRVGRRRQTRAGLHADEPHG